MTPDELREAEAKLRGGDAMAVRPPPDFKLYLHPDVAASLRKELAALRAERDRAWKITDKDGAEVSGPTLVERIGALQDANTALRAELASVREDARALTVRNLRARGGGIECTVCGAATQWLGQGEQRQVEWHKGGGSDCPVARSLTPGATGGR